MLRLLVVAAVFLLSLTVPAQAAPIGSFTETELWDSTDNDAYASFHVQGLAVVNDVVLTFTEGRPQVSDAGPKDLLMRRSTDGGRTWEASVPVVPADPAQSWGNATPVVDSQTGRVCLFYKGSGGSIFVKRSDDAGVSWSAPEDLTALFAANPHGWTRNSPIPGHGIQLRNGRLLMPVNHRAPDPDANYGFDMLYSDSHGEPGSWRRGTPAPLDPAYPINESRVYQRKDGSVVINGRWGAGGTRYRITSTSTDGGQTWSAPVVDGATGQFVSVDAGMTQLGDRLLFSRPDSSARANMTVSISYDEGASYRYSRVVNPGPSYYSDLGVLSDGTILLVYGRDGTLPSFPERITIARFDLAWLTNGRDSTSSSRELATTDTRGGTVVSDANALGGKALRGDSVDVPFDVATGTYDVAVRLQRRSDSGQVRVSVDGLFQGVIDPKMTVAEGYQVYRVGTLPLTAGRHWLRFTGAVVADQLILTSGSPADPPNVVADNDSVASFEVVSDNWDRVTTGTGYFGQSERVHAGGTGTAKVRFRPDVPMSGVYSAAVWYRAAAGQASNASFVVRHAEGQTTVKVDQRSGGGHWVPLGDFAFTAGGPGTIELSNAADGVVVADAVRLSYRGAVTDNDTVGFETISGEWNAATGVGGYYGDNYRTHPAGTGSAVVRWHPEIPVAGTYQVAVWYTSHSNRATNATYTMGTTAVTVDQRDHGSQWVPLGDFWLSPDSTVALSDAANGYVVADAIRVTYQGVVADNDTSNYEVLSGTWYPATGVPGYFGQNYRTHPAGTGTAVVRWHLDVPVAGMYQVAVWYTEHPNRASNARYTVGTTTVTVDQRDHGSQWVSLGDFWLTQDTTVTLSDAANGYVVADAVRLIPA